MDVSAQDTNSMDVAGIGVALEEIPCYIINLVTGTRIVFNVIPDEISDNNQAQFDDVAIRGRSTPLKGYSGSGPRNVSYTVELHDDYCPGGVLKTVNQLRALTYPNYDGTVIPPKCYVRLGYMVSMQAVPVSVGVTWKKPYRDGVYINATVSLDFAEVVNIPYSSGTIERGGDFVSG